MREALSTIAVFNTPNPLNEALVDDLVEAHLAALVTERGGVSERRSTSTAAE